MRPILLSKTTRTTRCSCATRSSRCNLINDIDVATTVESARTYVTRKMPALIISDIHLPGESGLDFLHWLRDQPAPLGSVPVIMMSVSTDEVHHMRASALRALIFMTKPIKQEVLLDQLRGLGLLVTHIPQGEQAGLIIEYRTH